MDTQQDITDELLAEIAKHPIVVAGFIEPHALSTIMEDWKTPREEGPFTVQPMRLRVLAEGSAQAISSGIQAMMCTIRYNFTQFGVNEIPPDSPNDYNHIPFNQQIEAPLAGNSTDKFPKDGTFIEPFINVNNEKLVINPEWETAKFVVRMRFNGLACKLYTGLLRNGSTFEIFMVMTPCRPPLCWYERRAV